jgi:hypothetical protein
LALAGFLAVVALGGLFCGLTRVAAWSEEPELDFYEPLASPRVVYTDTEVSSIHFGLVGAQAIAVDSRVTESGIFRIYFPLWYNDTRKNRP